MDNNPATSPKVVQLNPQKGGVLLPNKSFFNPKMFFVFGGLLVLLIGLGVGLVLIRQQQDIRSKASNLGSGQPVSPTPTDGQTAVDLSPTFKWDYETPNNTNCDPAGSYANVYLWNCAAHNDGCLIGFGGRTSDTQSVYEVPSTVIHPYSSPGVLDYSRSIAPLAANTQYWWYVTPKACGVLHFEENKAWTFTTGSAPPVTHKECQNNACVAVPGAGTDNCPNNCQPQATAACQLVSADKDLASIKIDDTVTFTGYGVTSAESEIIDKINFIISRDGIEVGNMEVAAVRDATKDSAFSGKAWKATQSYKVSIAGDYMVRIRVHWKDHDWKE